MNQHPISMFVPSTLGEYTGSDALTKKIIEKKGAVDSASLKEYGAIVGAMSGQAACVALGATAAVAYGCGILGGLIGGALAAAIPIAKGSGMGDVVIDTWNNQVKPYLDTGPKGVLAIKTYLVMRDKFILDAGGSASQVDAFLTSQGLPGAPVRARWAPDPKRAQAAKEFDVWNIPKDSALGEEAWTAKNVYGVDNKLYLLLRDHAAPPIASMEDRIDWGLVAWDEFIKVKGFKVTCEPELANTFVNHKYPNTLPRSCPTEQPTKLAAALVSKLAQVKYAPSSSSSSSAGGTVVKGAAVLAVAGIGLAIWKPALFTALKRAVMP